MPDKRKLHVKSSFLAFLALVRMPNLLIIVFAQFLIRVFVIGPKESWQSVLIEPYFLLLCLVTVMIAAAGYIINDYYDIKIDMVNNPKRVVIGNVFTRRVALFTHFSMNTIAVFLSLFLGWKVFLTVVIASFLMWYYSNSLKRLALWGNLVISLLSGISIYYLTFLSENNTYLVFIYAAFAFLISLIREIVKDMEDIKGDERFGCKTLPIVWGIPKTKYFVYAISLSFSIVMVLLFRERSSSLLLGYFLLVLFPLFSYFLVKLHKASKDLDYRRLSSLAKFIMILGLASMLII